MSDERITCPACRGEKASLAFVNRGDEPHEMREVSCAVCEGAGDVPIAKYWAWQRGRGFYEARVARGESLGECARRLGVGLAALSGWEHGRRDTLGVMHPGCKYMCQIGERCRKCGHVHDGLPPSTPGTAAADGGR